MDTVPPPLGLGQSEPWLDPAAVPHIKLTGIRKMFGDFVAVDGVDLSIYRGELFALLGASGCGKTTLLRMLAGFETPTEGTVVIDGTNVTRQPPFQRQVNMMFQSYALFPHMTVADNVAFGLRRDGVPTAERERRVAEVLELVQMSSFGRRKPHQLSGGQRQRVALARSLVKRPKVLLLDEPLSALDKKLREQTQFELMTIQRQVGITFVMVTHDQEEAMTMASRIAVMNRGQIIQIGRPRELYEYPQTRYIADFVGTMNMFEGRVTEDESDHVLVDSDEACGDLYLDHGISGTLGMTIWIAVRPEKMTISRLAPPPGPNQVRGVIVNIAYLGDVSIYNVRTGNGKIVQATAPNLSRYTEDEFGIGDAVHLSWAAEAGVALTE